MWTQASCHPPRHLRPASPVDHIASYAVGVFGVGHIMHGFGLRNVITACSVPIFSYPFL